MWSNASTPCVLTSQVCAHVQSLLGVEIPWTGFNQDVECWLGVTLDLAECLLKKEWRL